MIIIIVNESQEVVKKIINALQGTEDKSVTTDNIKVIKASHANDEVRETVVKLLKEGHTTSEVANLTQIPEGKVRAYKAHLTLGRY